jgi:carboxymethylenebutenolidase
MASSWEILKVRSTDDLLEDMATYVSQPASPERRSAVIVIQEIFGVNSNIQATADRLAAAGYFAVAPALFHRENMTEGVRGTNPIYGYGPYGGHEPDEKDAEARTKAIANFNDDNIILDVNTTIEWLKRHPRVQGDGIGIMGFCFGGRVTYLAASSCPGLSAASVFYGGNILQARGDGPSPVDRTANLQCPVLGNFGELDQNPTVDDVRQIEAELKSHGKTHDFKMYSGAGHGFYCDERNDYHEASAKDAWERTLAWFQKYLATVAATA